MAEQRSREGQRLGNYRLERLLGRGGFAEVYLGRHIHLQRPAAIKILQAHLSEREIDGFRQEAQIIAMLEHPHIVRIHDFDVQDGVPFLVMEYLPNGTMRQRHAKGERVPLPLVVSYVRQLADALQFAHDQRLIHRDVKPENMLLGRRDEVVLSDFGIASIAHSTSSMTVQSAIGTIPYMAPEQIQAHSRAASDQYSLGIVIYEWLSGERPFSGSSTEIFAKHMMVPPPPLRPKVPSLPVDVEQVISIALAKDPGQRFSSIQAFATALQAAASGTVQPVKVDVGERNLPSLSSTVPPTLLAAPASQAAVEFQTPALPPVTNPSSEPPLSPVMTPSQPIPAGSPKSNAQPKPSRRRLLIGLVVAGVAIGGGIAIPLLNPPLTLYTYHGHAGFVNGVAWSPDGSRIASASADSTVQVWDAVDGRHAYTYNGHSSEVYGVAWSLDGKWIASASADGTVQVWNAADGGHVYTYNGHTVPVYGVAWSPDGSRIASANVDHTVQVWDAADGGHAYTYNGHTVSVNAVAWSRDGKHIASASDDKTVQVWDAVDGGHVYTYNGHASLVTGVAWSPDGKQIASGSADSTVQVWGAADGGHVHTYNGHAGLVTGVAWSPDGKRIASASNDKTVQVWDAVDGGHVHTYNGHAGLVTGVAWSPDGKQIASASADMTVQVWEAK